ncbi:MAG: DNA repair protein RadA [Chloroflexota bacterium]
MPKTHTQYVCQECGRVTVREMGRCPQCGAFNSMIEQVVAPSAPPAAAHAGRVSALGRSTPRRLAEISGDVEERLAVSMGEFARVLGGGIVPGSVVLIGGDPGIGKSTLLLQVALEMARGLTVLYISGEESERQIKMRAVRLIRQEGIGRSSLEVAAHEMPDQLLLVTETSLAVIMEHIQAVRPQLVILDSVQTSYLPELDSSAGSVTQVREVASRLRELAKSTGIAVFLIGHVTKEGAIAGPRILEHIVDTVLYLEGDRYQSYRLLRSVKNRFGATSEVGVFEMRERGLVEVTNPSEAFLAERMANAPGSAIAVTMEGTRPLLVEVQGLTSPTSFGNPRRTPNGVDFNRLLLTSAVLTRRVGLHLGEQDIFVNVVGGITIDEPAADLAVAVAVTSSLKGAPVRADTVLIGEIGLSGELRMVSQMPARLREAANLGFRSAIVPRRLRHGEPWPQDIQVIEARSLRQALDQALLPPADEKDRAKS